ncbi:MAG: hypothetical protein ACOYN3_08285, partial [Acidimicrobiia bacterium]
TTLRTCAPWRRGADFILYRSADMDPHIEYTNLARRRAKKHDLVLYRHVFGKPEAPVSKSAVVTLDTAARIVLRLQLASAGALAPAPVALAPAPVALAGPLALAVIGNDFRIEKPELQLVVTHGAPPQVQALVNDLTDRWQPFGKTLARQLIGNARYLHLKPGEFARRVGDTYPPATGAESQSERAVRMLRHAAAKTLQASQVRIETDSGVRYLTLPFLSPDGIFLAHLAEMIQHDSTQRIATQILTGPHAARLEPRDRRNVEALRCDAEQRFTALANLTTRVASTVTSLRSKSVFIEEYPPLRDPVHDDNDVYVALSKLHDGSSPQAQIAMRKLLTTINEAARSHGVGQAARHDAPEQSGPLTR